ncbi:hypothetical protein [Halorarius halobius]|uniref:hypothetical protein n=1 Tax=Halorarius halobius TaxID=2962671 RepID=UPI0020CF2ED2|nr:hypothetical protein [Halorarius halobius]
MDDHNAEPGDAFGEVSASEERLDDAHHHQPKEDETETGGERCVVEPAVVRVWW